VLRIDLQGSKEVGPGFFVHLAVHSPLAQFDKRIGIGCIHLLELVFILVSKSDGIFNRDNISLWNRYCSKPTLYIDTGISFLDFPGNLNNFIAPPILDGLDISQGS